MSKKSKSAAPPQMFYTAAQLAAAKGLSVETVRLHAKNGKIPATKNSAGKWVFSHTDVFGSQAAPSAPNDTDVIFVLDRSGSMDGLIAEARKNLLSQLATLVQASGPNDHYAISIINFNDSLNVTMQSLDVTQTLGQPGERLYHAPSGMTKLYDAVLKAIELASAREDGHRAFLITIVTDGMENRSIASQAELARLIRNKVATDKYTFAYAGPAGSENTALSLGIAQGNITTWDQTVLGTAHLGGQTVSSLQSYSATRSTGVTNSTSFYAQPVNPNAQQFASQLTGQLGALAPAQFKVERVTAVDPVVIKDFCNRRFGTFPKGQVYYQLTESEKVQDYKKVVIQDVATGNFYAGQKSAMALLGIPNFVGIARVRPGNLGEFKVFIQSTSVNRKLVPGTALVRLL